jgi:hypothetical protein
MSLIEQILRVFDRVKADRLSTWKLWVFLNNYSTLPPEATRKGVRSFGRWLHKQLAPYGIASSQFRRTYVWGGSHVVHGYKRTDFEKILSQP